MALLMNRKGKKEAKKILTVAIGIQNTRCCRLTFFDTKSMAAFEKFENKKKFLEFASFLHPPFVKHLVSQVTMILV